MTARPIATILSNRNAMALLALMSLAWVSCAPHASRARSNDASSSGTLVFSAPSSLAAGSSKEGSSFQEGVDSTVNIRVNTDAVGAEQQAETSVAVNPTDAQNLVAAAIGAARNLFFTSADGGQTWTQGVLPTTAPTYASLYDPDVAFCADGSAYYESTGSNGVGLGGGIYVHKSTDGGQTWSSGSFVYKKAFGFPWPDKPWLACDTTGSTYQNRLYVSWGAVVSQVEGEHQIHFSHSADGGATWSAWLAVSDTTALQNGSQIAIGPGGEVYVTWARAFDPDNGSLGDIRFDMSTDGGVTFGTDSVVYDWNSVGRVEPEGHFALAADDGAGAHSGNIYVASVDHRNGDGDIFFFRSTDGGSSWGGPLRVNDDPIGNGAEQFHVAVTVDPKGRVIVTFSDNRHDIGTTLYKRWGAISRDGGATFDSNFVISDVAWDGSLSWVGDYNVVAATSDLIHPLWGGDTRAGVADSDAYTDRYPNVFDYDEVRDLAWLNADDLDFEPQDARFGENLDYDVISGSLSELQADAGFDRAACIGPQWPAPAFTDTDVPVSGDGHYYLIRVNGPSGVGTYGDGRPRARVGGRDPLDHSLVVCP